MSIKDKIITFLLKMLGGVPKTEETSQVVDITEEEKEILQKNKNKGKYFGRKSVLDEIKRLELEIVPLKIYSSEMYNQFKTKLDEITKKCNELYEDQVKKTEYTFKLTIGINPDEDLQIHNSLYELSEAIRQYKIQEFNYDASLKSLNDLKVLLSIIHQKLIAEPNIKELEHAYLRLDEIINEVCSVEVESNTLKQEEVCKSMCECIYIFLKCNALCDNYYEDFAFEEYYQKEEINFCEIFVNDIGKLIKKTEAFKNTKYYTRYNPYLNNLLVRENVRKNILTDKDFIKKFVQIEKKIFELHYYYEKKNAASNISTDLIAVYELKNYIKTLYEKYEDQENIAKKLFLFKTFVDNLKYDITSYEVYKLVYFFGLKTFLLQEIRAKDDTDIMKNIFKLQKNTKILSINMPENQDVKYYKLSSFEKSNINIKEVKKVLNKLFDYKELEDENYFHIYFSDSFFKDCDLIQKSLNKLEKL